MHSPKLRSSVSQQQEEGWYPTIRWCLLVWAILRLLVSGIWTGTIMLGTFGFLQHEAQEKTATNYEDHNPSRLWIFIYAILVQLVEFGMIVTFITAGVKKSARLYRAYYRYCILTLITYIIVVTLSFPLEYFGYANHLVEVYLTYHIEILPFIGDFQYFGVAFILVAIFDVGLEILLIISIKKLIERYSYTPSESV